MIVIAGNQNDYNEMLGELNEESLNAATRCACMCSCANCGRCGCSCICTGGNCNCRFFPNDIAKGSEETLSDFFAL